MDVFIVLKHLFLLIFSIGQIESTTTFNESFIDIDPLRSESIPSDSSGSVEISEDIVEEKTEEFSGLNIDFFIEAIKNFLLSVEYNNDFTSKAAFIQSFDYLIYGPRAPPYIRA